MQLSKIFLALMASSTLVLTGCGGGGGSSSGNDTENPGTPSGGDNNSGGDDSGDNTSGDGGNTQQASWSAPVSLADGSVTNNDLMVGGAGGKPLIVYRSGALILARAFDGSNWNSGSMINSSNGVWNLSLETNANGKAVIGSTYQLTNPSTGYTECHIQYYRYNSTNWGSANRIRTFAHTNNNYSCYNIRTLKLGLSDDDRVSMTYWREDNSTGRIQSCDSSDQCLTAVNADAQSTSDKQVVGLGSANGGDSQILMLDYPELQSSASRIFSSALTDGTPGSGMIIPGSTTATGVATLAVNDANHALALYIQGTTLKGSFNNGSGFATATDLDTDLSTSAPISTYLSDGADYGLSIWKNNNAVNAVISDAGSFASAIQNTNSHSYITGATGSINDNGKAVIAWVGFDNPPIDSTISAGTLYARFYDGSQWLDVQTIDTGISVESGAIMKGGLGVYLDNSDDATVAYSAYKDGQVYSEPQLFFSRRVID